MFIYLSKKIAIPNSTRLHSLGWNPEHGWIAAGGDDGLLKVLKLDSPREKGSLSMNQTLEGHQGSVLCATWNAPYRKLTTSDQNGLIIVWMLHKGVWFEEMVNNRNKSVVADMKWTADGQKICIVYRDGAVIVGSVDGNRLWGKDLSASLAGVEWSPDARRILFVSTDRRVFVYDHNGTQLNDLKVLMDDDDHIVSVHWYDGMEGCADRDAPALAVAYSRGRVQLMRAVDDIHPIVIHTGFTKLTQCKWNTTGNVLAVAGSRPQQQQQQQQQERTDERQVSFVHFYGPRGGDKLRSMKVPGGGISGLSWEGGGLRIALAVDSYVYFANIRPDFHWGYFADDTLVVAYSLPEKGGTAAVFWNLKTGERIQKGVSGLVAIRTVKHAEFCLVVEDGGRLSLRNAIGSTVESRLCPTNAVFSTITSTVAIVASTRFVYVWHFARASPNQLQELISAASSSSSGAEGTSTAGRERVLDIENDNAVDVDAFESSQKNDVDLEDFDKIVAVCASEKVLMVARASGTIHQYTLPYLVFEARHHSTFVPWKMSLNCDSTKLAIVDSSGGLGIMDLSSPQEDKSGVILPFERKDTWDVLWAEDDPKLFAAMEKAKLYVYNDLQPEKDPVSCAGYLAEFKNLKVTSIVVEDVVENPDTMDNVVVVNETAPLRALREILESSGCAEAYTAVQEQPHPQLWLCLAEAALEALDLNIAEKAYVRCRNYRGIQFVKRLKTLSDRMKQRAEVSAFFGRFDEADQIYIDIDRKDLAVQLRQDLGDWARVAQIIKSGGGGDDRQLNHAWCKLGDQYALAMRWDKAREYYELAKDHPEKLAECYYRLGEFQALEDLLKSLPDGSRELFLDIGRKFESVGLHNPAVDAYLRADEGKMAVDCCVLLNRWDRAIDVAQQYGFPQIEGLLIKYVNQLMKDGKKLLAVELYRKANKPTEAAKLLATIAEEVGIKGSSPVRAKKIHVLAALEVERHRKKAFDLMNRGTSTQATVAQTTAATLDTLMTHDAEATRGSAGAKVLDNAWRGAAAYHFYLLAHRQLYAGQYEKAQFTGIRLAEFEDIIERRDMYSLIALAALHDKNWYLCSKAFTKLETLEDSPKEEHQNFEFLAVKIFSEHPPDPVEDMPECYLKCLDFGIPYHACVVTGQAILNQRTIKCKTCRHHAIETELLRAAVCPLCHSPYPDLSL